MLTKKKHKKLKTLKFGKTTKNEMVLRYNSGQVAFPRANRGTNDGRPHDDS